FKLVNDKYGHDQGDKLLKVVAQSLLFYARKNDSVFRRSGDEFVIIAPSMLKSEAKMLAMVIIDKITEDTSKLALDGTEVTVSIGIAMYPDDGTSSDELFKKADHALYAAKERGK